MEEKYRARFRVKVAKSLDLPESVANFIVGDTDVTISAQKPTNKISDSKWLVLDAKDFPSLECARNYGEKLKVACELVSACLKLGIDSGRDIATGGFGKLVKDQIKDDYGIVFRNSIHGLDVFPDDSNIRFCSSSAQGTLKFSGKAFMEELSRIFQSVDSASQETKDIALLLNYALMRPDPIGKLVFAFSAVEMMGQNEKWSKSQKQMIESLAIYVLEQDVGTHSERKEIYDSIQKGLHKLSLRQGVLRLLTNLGLSDKKKYWDSLYSERSTLIHGLAPRPGVDYSGFASRSFNFCGHILLRIIAKEIPSINNFIDCYYPLED